VSFWKGAREAIGPLCSAPCDVCGTPSLRLDIWKRLVLNGFDIVNLIDLLHDECNLPDRPAFTYRALRLSPRLYSPQPHHFHLSIFRLAFFIFLHIYFDSPVTCYNMAVAGPIPSIVGALSCQKDSYLQSLETEVVSCIEYELPKAPQTKGKSKSKKPGDVDKAIEGDGTPPSKTWLIEFADSVLFPEGLLPNPTSLSSLLIVNRRRSTHRSWVHHSHILFRLWNSSNHQHPTPWSPLHLLFHQTPLPRDQGPSRCQFHSSLGPHAATHWPTPSLRYNGLARSTHSELEHGRRW